MSAFDDEFGLFGDEEGEEEERKSTLGARKIASSETIIDEIEPEDEPSPRRFRGRPGAPDRPGNGTFVGRRSREREPRAPLADDIAIPRAVELLTFLAQKLVSKPEAVRVEVQRDEKGTVLELYVAADDVGKVIGRAGRVAQALRTVVRAGAEGRVTVDIVDVDELEAQASGEPSSRPERGRRGRGTSAPKASPAAADDDAAEDDESDDEHEVEVIYVVEEDDGDEVSDETSEDEDEAAQAPRARAARGAAAKKAGSKKAAATKKVAKATAPAARGAKKSAKPAASKATAAKTSAKAPAKTTAAKAATKAAAPGKSTAAKAGTKSTTSKALASKPAARKAAAKTATSAKKAVGARAATAKKAATRKKKS